MLENQRLDFIKQTMLKHEDTFRHQVRELHRLYNVQKNLMTTLRSETRQQLEFSPHANDLRKVAGFDLTRPVEEDLWCEDSAHDIDGQMCSNDVELTLSIGPSSTSSSKSSRRSQNGVDVSKAMMKTSLGSSSALYNQETRDQIGFFRI